MECLPLGKDRKVFEFFDQLNELFGYRPNVNPLATASSSGMGDTGPVLVDDTDNESTPACEEIPQISERKKKVGPSRKRVRSQETEEMPTWLKKIREERKADDDAWREQRFIMHKDKMDKLNELISLLKPAR